MSIFFCDLATSPSQMEIDLTPANGFAPAILREAPLHPIPGRILAAMLMSLLGRYTESAQL